MKIMKMSLALASLALLSTVAACGKDDKSGGIAAAAPAAAPAVAQEDKGGGAAAAPAVTLHLAGINALVPAALKAKVAFEKAEIKRERGSRTTAFTLAAPKGWAQESKEFSNLSPAGQDMLGTSIDVGTNCAGVCEPKDWAAVSDEDFAQFKDAKILKDEKTPTSRLMIAEMSDKTYVQHATWTAGAKRYATCVVTLEDEYREAAPAFAKACQTVGMSGDD